MEQKIEKAVSEAISKIFADENGPIAQLSEYIHKEVSHKKLGAIENGIHYMMRSQEEIKADLGKLWEKREQDRDAARERSEKIEKNLSEVLKENNKELADQFNTTWCEKHQSIIDWQTRNIDWQTTTNESIEKLKETVRPIGPIKVAIGIICVAFLGGVGSFAAEIAFSKAHAFIESKK